MCVSGSAVSGKIVVDLWRKQVVHLPRRKTWQMHVEKLVSDYPLFSYISARTKNKSRYEKSLSL
jgi:hypothetical protein